MRFIYFFFIALFLFSCKEKEVYMFTSHREPATDGLHFLYSYDGLHWDSLAGVWLKPQIGNKTIYYNYHTKKMETPKLYPNPMMRDPSIIQGPDGTFHLVWTISWEGEKGFGYSSSKDLINWTEQREIRVMADSMTNNVWAPELFYDDTKDQFMIIWSSSILPEKYTEADKLGTNKAHRAYYTTTKDFKHFSVPKRFYDPGYNSIDGFLLKRGEKDYVFIIKDNRKPNYSNLFCVFSDNPEGPFTNPSVNFGPTYSEGPCAIKVGDEWLIYFDEYRQFKYGAVKTRDFKTFTSIDDQISYPKGHKHGTIFKVKESILLKMKEKERNLFKNDSGY